jgi:hypothetical protein
MEIKYLDIFYRISGNMQQDIKVFMMCNHQKLLSKEIPALYDFSDLEMFEIMRMPVISLPLTKECPVREKVYMYLELFCCSYLHGCMFIYLFSGEMWKYYFKIY